MYKVIELVEMEVNEENPSLFDIALRIYYN